MTINQIIKGHEAEIERLRKQLAAARDDVARLDKAIRRIATMECHSEGGIPVTPSELREIARAALAAQPPTPGITDTEILDWLQAKGIATQEDDGTFAAKKMGIHSWCDHDAGVLRWTARWINSECKSLREAARIAIRAERGGK